MISKYLKAITTKVYQLLITYPIYYSSLIIYLDIEY